MLGLKQPLILLSLLLLSPGISMELPISYDLLNVIFDETSETIAEFPDGSHFSLNCNRLKAEQVEYKVEGRSVPAVRIHCDQARRPLNKSAIWLFGGPFISFSPDLLPPEHLVLLDLGYVLVVPLYIGTAEREYEFVGDRLSPDMDEAVREVASLVEAFQSAGPVVLVGQSFGGLLASAVATQLRENDALVLLGSPLVPFPEVIRRQNVPISSLLDQPFLDDLELGFAQPSGPMRLQNEAGVPSTSLEEQTELSLRVLRGFFGKRWLEQDPVALLAGHPARSLVVMREGDARVGPERLQVLRDMQNPRIHLLVLSGEEHASVLARRELDEFKRLLLEVTSDVQVPIPDSAKPER